MAKQIKDVFSKVLKARNFDIPAPKELKEVNGKKILIEVKDLVLSFKNPGSPDENSLVIRKTSFELREGEVLAIIGESGSGKSVITSALYGLVGSNAVVESGVINVLGHEVQNFNSGQ